MYVCTEAWYASLYILMDELFYVPLEAIATRCIPHVVRTMLLDA